MTVYLLIIPALFCLGAVWRYRLFKRLEDAERRLCALENGGAEEENPDGGSEVLKKLEAEEAERLYSEGIANILGYDYTKKRDE